MAFRQWSEKEACLKSKFLPESNKTTKQTSDIGISKVPYIKHARRFTGIWPGSRKLVGQPETALKWSPVYDDEAYDEGPSTSKEPDGDVEELQTIKSLRDVYKAKERGQNVSLFSHSKQNTDHRDGQKSVTYKSTLHIGPTKCLVSQDVTCVRYEHAENAAVNKFVKPQNETREAPTEQEMITIALDEDTGETDHKQKVPESRHHEDIIDNKLDTTGVQLSRLEPSTEQSINEFVSKYNLKQLNPDENPINMFDSNVLNRQIFEFILHRMKNGFDDYDLQIVGLKTIYLVLLSVTQISDCEIKEEWLNISLQAGCMYYDSYEVRELTLRIIICSIPFVRENQQSLWPERVLHFIIARYDTFETLHCQTVSSTWQALLTLFKCTRTVCPIFVQMGGFSYMYHQAAILPGNGHALILHHGSEIMKTFDDIVLQTQSFPSGKLSYDILVAVQTFSKAPETLKCAGFCLCREALNAAASYLFYDTDFIKQIVIKLQMIISANGAARRVNNFTKRLQKLAFGILTDVCNRSLVAVDFVISQGYIESMLMSLFGRHPRNLELDKKKCELLDVVYRKKIKQSLLTVSERLEFRPNMMSKVIDVKNVKRNVTILQGVHEMFLSGIKTAIVQDGWGVDSLIDFLKTHPSHPRVRESVCLILEDICNENGKVLSELRTNNELVRILVEISSTYMHSTKVKESIFRILADLTANPVTISLSDVEKRYIHKFLVGTRLAAKEFKPLITVKYGYVSKFQAGNITELVEAVVLAMRQNKYVPSLQIAGCRILRNLASQRCMFIAKRVVRLKGVDALFLALQNYNDNSFLREIAWTALYYLCLNSSILCTIIETRIQMKGIHFD